MHTYPFTIDNGHGELLTFSRRVTNADGEHVEGENRVAPGKGPPMHVHYQQDEALTVISGKIGYQLAGGEPKYAGPGETAMFRAGEAHRFWNAGDTELHCTAWISPPGNVEYFLSEIFASTKRNGGRPDPFEAAYLMRRYRSEFRMMAVPSLVQSVVFPFVVVIGTVLGKYRKYAGAPEPIRAT